MASAPTNHPLEPLTQARQSFEDTVVEFDGIDYFISKEMAGDTVTTQEKMM